MSDRFSECLSLMLIEEGGYSDDANDPGGATNWGITRATLADWRNATVSKEDVRLLTRSEAAEIYRRRYWQPMRCADLPAGVDLMVFDLGVNAGPGRSVRILQRTVGVSSDGVIGPQTLAAVAGCPVDKLILRLSDARLSYYRTLDGWRWFSRGWTARTARITEHARDAARGSVAPPVAVVVPPPPPEPPDAPQQQDPIGSAG